MSEETATEYKGDLPKVNEISQKFLEDIEDERQRLSQDFPLCAMLINEAIDKVLSTGRIPGREFYADVYKQKPMKVTQKVFVPVNQFPKFNFTGKILGPKGNSLRRLQEETQCRIAIKGRGSMRDRAKEEEYRLTDDPRFTHLQKDLFVEISTVATPAECYARIAYALAEIRKYIIPDKNDEVSHEQLRELMEIDPKLAQREHVNPSAYRSVFDKPTFSTSSAPKYLNLLKRTIHTQPEEIRTKPYSSVTYMKHTPKSFLKRTAEHSSEEETADSKRARALRSLRQHY